MLDFRNLNTLWASILAETLSRCGLTTTIVCPGSRSAPLAVAFAQHPHIEAIPVLDERSASFFALGIAKRTHKPVVIVCTSGTAGANFYPAVIEARESRVPLLILTADRPPEMRDCNSGQTIDQQKLFGQYVKHYSELATPSVARLDYLRQTIAQAYHQALYPTPGAVHLNLPLRDPLAPISQPEIAALAETFPEDFFQHLSSQSPINSSWDIPAAWYDRQGIIIAGVAAPTNPEFYVSQIAKLSRTLGYPVLAEGLSPLRNYANLQTHLITTYDKILRTPALAKTLQPEIVIRIGEMPTSKVLREWLTKCQPQTWIISESSRSIDPLHGRSQQIFATISDLKVPLKKGDLGGLPLPPPTDYRQTWSIAEQKTRYTIDQTLNATSQLLESKVAWLLSQTLPQNSQIFISNSMPVRDVEYFWQPNDRHIHPFFNRGANGIDGTLSTALGVAHHGQPTVLLTGDLALLHDTNGFLIRQYFQGSLTIVLINNNGGGIFGMLPIAQFDPPFEEFFSTPQNINFANLCQTYEIEHTIIQDWQHFEQCLSRIAINGIRILEIKTDRHHDTQWRKQFFQNPLSKTPLPKNL
jgi:2-succinyl-5-enolpyruvyl-6-hydroxy-3-cyclohexene-1-carboxylate synthase